MTTTKELKDFITLDSVVVEDGLFTKLGAAVKGAISGAKAGWNKTSTSSSNGDGKAKGKGKYGLSHPDGTPCDAKKPEACPIMRKQLADKADKKEDPKSKKIAEKVEKSVEKVDDLKKNDTKGKDPLENLSDEQWKQLDSKITPIVDKNIGDGFSVELDGDEYLAIWKQDFEYIDDGDSVTPSTGWEPTNPK